MELIAILKELGLPAIGIAGMLMVYFWSSKKTERKIDALEIKMDKKIDTIEVKMDKKIDAIQKDVVSIQQNVEDLSMESLKSRITN